MIRLCPITVLMTPFLAFAAPALPKVNSGAVILTAAVGLAVTRAADAQSRQGELRGVWVDKGYNRDWPTIMQCLRSNGFNALFANFSSAVAYYPSKVLPAAEGTVPDRNELLEAARAARQHGIELHVSRINWSLSGVSDQLRAQLESAGRLQRDHSGRLGRDDPDLGVNWLCPSHPENRKLEREAMLEIIRNYDIDGIQFDCMRFPGANYCFCEQCRSRFQKETGIEVERWPDGVLPGSQHAERWRQWRRDLLTSLVAEIREEIYHIKPHAFVSLAAWPGLDSARDEMAQDWPLWVREGALDFMCPTDYTADREELLGLVRPQVEATQGIVPLYAGLGAFLMRSASTFIDQVEAVRESGADGFVAFAYHSGDFESWLPDLHATVAASDPDPMPHRSPPARFVFAGPAVASPVAKGEALAGAALEVNLAVGALPPTPDTAEADDEAAAQAAGMLRRATESRTPVTSYGASPDYGAGPEEETRLSGRIIAETPAGRVLAPLGAFSADSRFERALRLSAPKGPFRIAVYGSLNTGADEKSDFVCRSPLLLGVTEEEVSARHGPIRSELERYWEQFCRQLSAPAIMGIDGTIQVHATGAGGGDWWLRLKAGRCESGVGAIDGADVTVTVSADDLLAVTRQETSPLALWESGRMTASGDLSLLRELAEALGYDTYP